MEVRIAGTGSCVPDGVLDNEALSAMVDTSDEWIRSRTGVARRHIAKQETTVDLAAAAAKRALEDAGMKAEEIQFILVATSSAEQTMPGVACMVQERIGAVNAACLDVNAACSGFLAAYQMALGMLQAKMAEQVLVIGAERMSSLVDWTDRSTCVLFGDGAGAVVLKGTGMRENAEVSESGQGTTAVSHAPESGQATTAVSHAPGSGLGTTAILHTDGRGGKYLTSRPAPGPIAMDGKEVFKFAVQKVPESIREVLLKAEAPIEDVDYFFLHQANRRIIESVAKRLQMDLEKFPMNMEEYGNMSSASIPVLLDEWNRAGRLKPGMKLVLAGFGAGLTWGAVLLTW